jgi:A/G-specific adenine glycosylase
MPTPSARPAPSKIKLLHERVRAFYRSQGRDLPWRRTRDPYRILVSEVMLQQTQVDRVIPKYRSFLSRFPTTAALARARLADVLHAWLGLGYNSRALRLWRCAQAIVRDHDGELPQDPGLLETLPGIGSYTAAAVASLAFGKSVPVVDTNVRRVLARTLTGRDRASAGAVMQLAKATLPRRGNAQWVQGLMDIGARFCRSSPRCDACPLRSACAFARHGARRRRIAQRASSPYAGSDRYYRGRLIRLLCERRTVTLREAGRQVKQRFGARDVSWLLRIARALERDGLITFARGGRRIQLA